MGAGVNDFFYFESKFLNEKKNFGGGYGEGGGQGG